MLIESCDHRSTVLSLARLEIEWTIVYMLLAWYCRTSGGGRWKLVTSSYVTSFVFPHCQRGYFFMVLVAGIKLLVLVTDTLFFKLMVSYYVRILSQVLGCATAQHSG